jgi:small subunit ribosomal protein S16
VATKIRLMRLGKIRAPYYRIVVADARTKRDGRVIETIGKYHPKQDPSLIEVDSDRARYWLSVGAQPTEPVAAILKITGDWQAHKGLPAPEHGIQYAAPKADRKAIFEAAAKETLDGGTAKKTLEPAKDAPAKKTAAKKTAAKKTAPADGDGAEAAVADVPSADAPAEPETAAESAPAAPAVETPPVETPAAEPEASADAPEAPAEPEAAAAEPAAETSSEG